jgi:enoyl-CoA hydratase
VASLAPELIVRRDGALGRLTLNRPEALGALTTGMCEGMIAAFGEWRDDPDVEAVLIDHAGSRGFCAGGDIRTLAESAAGDGVEALRFFETEYRLDALIAGYRKPVITVMDGVVMGGGVGISLPARYRIATERTRFAMPETGIGLFPDVGAGWFLPKLPGRTGLWIALTGARLAAADCLRLGLATHAVESARLDDLKAAFAAAPDAIDVVLTQFNADPGHPPIAYQEADIDRLFAGDDLETVFAALAYDDSEWAKAQLAAMAPKSPLSAKVAFRLIAGGLEPKSLAGDLQVEYRLAARLVMRPDFREGVRAVIVDKDNAPAWSPASLGGVSEALVDEMFAPLADGREWTPEGGWTWPTRP